MFFKRIVIDVYVVHRPTVNNGKLNHRPKRATTRLQVSRNGTHFQGIESDPAKWDIGMLRSGCLQDAAVSVEA